MERLPFRVNSNADLAKRFATALSRAPLLPLAITGAAGGILAEQVITAPTAYAQEQKDCFVNVEVQRPTAGEEYAVTDKSTLVVPCTEEGMILLNAGEQGSIRKGLLHWETHAVMWGSIGLLIGMLGIVVALNTPDAVKKERK